MPIYEYQCTACGHALDALQKFSDEPLTDCPECGKPALQKQISAPSFQLKGTGWYATDFRNKPAAEGENKKTAPTTTSTTESKNDATVSPDKTKTDPTGT